MNDYTDIKAGLYRLLKKGCPGRDFAEDQCLVEQGLNSLAAARFILEIGIEFKVELPLEKFADGLSLKEIQNLIICHDVQDEPKAKTVKNKKKKRGSDIPLRPLQQAYLITSDESYSADPVGCHIYREFDVENTDAAQIVTAWQKLCKLQPMLCASVNKNGLLEMGAPPIPEIFHLKKDKDKKNIFSKKAAVLRQKMQDRGNRLEKGLVAAILLESPEKLRIFLSVDGLVMDGQSMEILQHYWACLISDPSSSLPASSLDYGQCVELLNAADQEKNRQYWQNILKTAPKAPFAEPCQQALAAKKDRSGGGKPHARRALDFFIPSPVWQHCEKRAKALKISPNSLIFSIFSQVILEFCQAGKASFILTTSERSRLPETVNHLIGSFTSSMIVPVEIDPANSLDQLAIKLHQEIWQHVSHNAYGAVEALRELGHGPGDVFPVVFTSLLGLDNGGECENFEQTFASCQTAQVALEHQMAEREGGLSIHWDVADTLLPDFAADICFSRLINRILTMGAEVRTGPQLNPLQQAYLFERFSKEDVHNCNAVFSVILPELDLETVAREWGDFIATYPALRNFVDEKCQNLIFENKEFRPYISFRDVTSGDLEDARDQLDKILADHRPTLGQYPLQEIHVLKSEGGKYSLHLVFDLLFLDGKSIHSIVSGFIQRLGNNQPALIKSDPALNGAKWVDHKRWPAYWSSKVANMPAGPPIKCGDFDHKDWDRLSIQLSGFELFEKICEQAGYTADMLLSAAMSAAWMSDIKRPFTIPMVFWREEDDRQRPCEASQMAWPVMTADLYETSGGDMTEMLILLLRSYCKDIISDLSHGGIYGLRQISSHCQTSRRNKTGAEESGSFSLPLVYTSMVKWDILPDEIAEQIKWHTKTPGIALDAVSLSTGDRHISAWDYMPEAFDEGQVARIFDRYTSLVKNVFSDPKAFFAKAEQCGDKPGGEKVECKPQGIAEPIHLAFERSARKYAEKTALYWQDGQWTFHQLNQYANKIAAKLRKLGVQAESKVAISIKRGPEMVAATLGVLKAGGVYVPIEPTQPPERAENMLKLSQAEVILTSSDTGIWSLPDDYKIVRVDELDDEATDNLPLINDVNSTAYIIFTSGSTGEPKGVAVNHKALQNLMAWCQKKYKFGPADMGLCVTSLGFDLSVFDILGLLGYGAGLYVANEKEQYDPALLFDVLSSHKITFWNSAPKTFEHLSEYFPDLSGRDEARDLRLVFLSGDYTSLDFPPKLFSTFPKARLTSLGGATEATVWSNFFEVEQVEAEWRSIPYGKPIDNAEYYILDQDKKPCPTGVEGDLFIAGTVLSLGYYNRPELTAERFIANPFMEGQAKMYDTGDRAVWMADGNMSFRGRSDRQVKVRGVRIELEEIEHAIRQQPQVQEVIVLLEKDPSDDVKIAAYIRSDQALAKRDILRFLEKKLPRNMMPNHVHILDKMPTTVNGKLDRKALSAPPPDREEKINGAHNDGLEQALRDEIQDILVDITGTEIDPEIDLWDQGATSFTMVQLSRRLQAGRGIKLQVEWLLEAPTVKAIARVIYSILDKDRDIKIPNTPPVQKQEIAKQEKAKQENENLPEAERVDLLDPEAKRRFLQQGLNLRQDLKDRETVALATEEIAPDWLKWRGVQRKFLKKNIMLSALGGLLSLLKGHKTDERLQYFYPSAGDSYAVQVYLWIRQGQVEGLEGGYYWFDGTNGHLSRVSDETRLERSDQFIYNRDILDQSAIALFLVAEKNAIEPLYGENAEKFLLLEAGYMGQLLLLAQAHHGLGICPIGSFKTDAVHANLLLSDSQQILHSFLIGPVEHEKSETGLLPPLSKVYAEKTTVFNKENIHENKVGENIAIIGHGLKYANANSADEFWQILSSGTSVLSQAPNRKGLPDHSGIVGGFLPAIDEFDAGFFKLSPREARHMDPQTRLLLEVCGHCLEHAGHNAKSLQQADERVGVYVGALWQDYRQVGLDQAKPSYVSASGTEMANRLSQFFNFTGPSIAVDNSCASGLTALHLAAKAIENGDCDSALVCAVNLMTHPSHARLLSELDLVSNKLPDGMYDENMQGWPVGEGAGAILLRRTKAKHAEADRILAIVEKTHVEHSGARAGYGSPSRETIEAGLGAILKKAGLGAEDIDYVEAAASGALMSDAAEWQALSNIFTKGVKIGSLKPNIGHLEAASGLSQLSKIILQIEHSQLAPSLMAAHRSSLIEDNSLEIVDKITKLDTAKHEPRFLINAVGSTGVSALALLRKNKSPLNDPVLEGVNYLLLSAQSKAQLYQLAKDYHACLKNSEARDWNAICGTSQMSRSQQDVRLAIEATTLKQAVVQLENLLDDGQAFEDKVSQSGLQFLDQYSTANTAGMALKDWLRGYQVHWQKFWPETPKRMALPLYPYQHEKYWLAQGAVKSENKVSGADHWLEKTCAAYSEVSEIPLADLNPHRPLEHYGLTSRLAGEFSALINRRLNNARVQATLLYEYRDLKAVSCAISEIENAGSEIETQGHAGPRENHETSSIHPKAADISNRKIAVTGMAGLFPESENLEALWENLAAGHDLVKGMPESRKYDGIGAEIMQGSFLSDIAAFDPFLFGITPHDAARMDPQERILLQLVWHAMEDACYPPSRIKAELDGNVGVYVGAMHNEYPLLGRDKSTEEMAYDTGGSLAGLANRISYHFDLNGPSLSVDSMCSSSLSALDLAIDALRSGKIKMAVVAASNLSIHPNKFVQQLRMKMTAPDHRCKSFAEGGDGFIPGEGAGVLILRPLNPAQAAGDRIQALILGTALNHGGKVNGFTVPNSISQGALLKQALTDAGVAAESISYVEAHGTGTFLGDPIETRAIIEALALCPTSEKLTIGSIKSNMGHLEGAAGMAGLIKVILQMRHKKILPSLHARNLNSVIDWRCLNLPDRLQDWQPREEDGQHVWRAGVSAFGAGGSNGHVILESYENNTVAQKMPSPSMQLLVLSGASENALKANAHKCAAALSQYEGDKLNLQEVCATLQMGREALAERWAYLVSDFDTAIKALRQCAAGSNSGFRGRAKATDKIIADKIPLNEAAEEWVRGAKVLWPRFYEKQPRMISLPSYVFETVPCWLDHINQGIALEGLHDKKAPGAGQAKIVEYVWHPFEKPAFEKEALEKAQVKDTSILCVVNKKSRKLAEDLQVLYGCQMIIHMLGHDIDTLKDFDFERVIFFNDLDGGADQDWQGSFEIAGLLARKAQRTPLHFIHLVSGLHPPVANGRAQSGAIFAGLMRNLASESKNIDATILDVGIFDLSDRTSCETCCQTIISELQQPTNGDVCASRLGWSRPDWKEVSHSSEPWRPDERSFYIITGGTRGLGAKLALQLAEKGAGKLGLIGRRQSDETDRLIEKLRGSGVDVRVFYGAVEDSEKIRAWFKELDNEQGNIGGIFHCAGQSSLQKNSFQAMDEADIKRVMRPKVDGLLSLLPLIETYNPEFVIAFSSISAVVAQVGVGVGDYASANLAMEYLASQKHRHGLSMLKTIAWPVWHSSNAGDVARATMKKFNLPILSDAAGFELLWTLITMPGSGRYAVVSPDWQYHDFDKKQKNPSPVARNTPPLRAERENSVAPDRFERIKERLKTIVARRTGMPEDVIHTQMRFSDMGVESVMLGELVEDMEDAFGHPVEPGILLQHDTIELLAANLLEQAGPDVENNKTEEDKTADDQKSKAPLNKACRNKVAIIGMAVDFPGAGSVAEFSRMLRQGRCAISEVPEERWNINTLYDEKRTPGKSLSRWGGFLPHLRDFDPDWFQMTEDVARSLDPAIRLFLEASENCLRDAGFRAEDLKKKTGVFVGGRMGNYHMRATDRNGDAALGTDQNFIAAYLAHHFDIHGPNLVVDTACSSSLTALHLACQSIRSGESELAFCGGVDILLDEEVYLQFSKAGALSPTGKCRTFDRHADGFVPGEGVGIFLLKRLDKALADGDLIRGVIEGSAVNNDGRTMGLTTPNPDAQKEVIMSALEDAGRKAGDIGLIEAHGTATMIGDPIELRALQQAFRVSSDEENFCAVGSVKSNIGHLLSAAGIAGLAKIVLAVEEDFIPPTLFCEEENPRFNLKQSPFYIAHEASQWSQGKDRIAGVSAFGLGGTNAHVIVAAAPKHVSARQRLPLAEFRRRRLWLEKGTEHLSEPVETLSLLDLNFIDLPPETAQMEQEDRL